MKAQVNRVLASFTPTAAPACPLRDADLALAGSLPRTRCRALQPTRRPLPPGWRHPCAAVIEQPELARSFGVLRRARFSRCPTLRWLPSPPTSTCGPRPMTASPVYGFQPASIANSSTKTAMRNPTPRPATSACGKSAMSWSASARKQAPGLRTTAGPAARRMADHGKPTASRTLERRADRAVVAA